MSKFSFDSVPQQTGCRWFVKKGDVTTDDRGFRSKAEADAWIKAFGDELEWRAGYVFALYGDAEHIEIRDREGALARA